MRTKVQFNSDGNVLSGLLESPDSDVRCYALFAHCFTCGKDIAAASRIARALTKNGIAVLRFDFTGLGNSDGDFSNTNFSSNIQDLVAAADFLREEYQAPQLLIGHSLGGAAILSVAPQVPEAKAVATIGAPHEADHVVHNFEASIDEINKNGQAEVTLGVRKFFIKKQFLDDLEQYSANSAKKSLALKKAVLVMHSPIDSTVSINEAEKIYKDLKHPKSFVSLDNADHLLTKKADSEYVADTIASWASRYLPERAEAAAAEKPNADSAIKKGHVMVEEKNHKFTQHVSSDSHYWLADEPVALGGDNTGPDPYEMMLAALGACTSMTLRLYATRKKLPLTHVKVELKHNRTHGKECENCEEKSETTEVINREITLVGDLNPEQRERLLEIADMCPVHKTLHANLEVSSSLV